MGYMFLKERFKIKPAFFRVFVTTLSFLCINSRVKRNFQKSVGDFPLFSLKFFSLKYRSFIKQIRSEPKPMDGHFTGGRQP